MEDKYKIKPIYYAMGSTMEIMPTGNYAEYMPKGTASQRLNNNWKRVGETLVKSVESHDKKDIEYSYT